MATAIEVLSVNAKANSDLSAKQFYIVKLTAADTVDLTSATTDLHFGVLGNAPKQNAAAEVITDGIAKVVSDGSGSAISVNDEVGTDTSGRAIKCTTTDRPLVGRALDASSAAGTVIRVKLYPAGTRYRTPA